MRKFHIFFLLVYFIVINPTFTQSFDGEWSVDYVTSDSADSLNSIGQRVISVTALAEDSFVALVNRGSANAYYIVGFKNAGKNQGRLGIYQNPETDKQTKWINLFDQEYLYDANDLASNGNLIFVANNAEAKHSILVFELKEDSVYTYPQRYKANNYIWAIDIDGNGRIYVTKTGDSLTAGSVMVLENPNIEPVWTSSGNAGTILQEFSVPDLGSLRGLTVNEDGTVLYVSNWDENKIYCYTGDPVNGYSLYEGFNFTVDNEFQTAGDLLTVGPFGLQLMPTKNLLFITHDADFKQSDGYGYGRIYIANPNTGDVLDTINTAEWNFAIEGQYDNHNPQNKASGYTSNYAVDFDENDNLYTQSYFGWTVDKWIYSGVLPTIELTITSVEKTNTPIPNEISLQQNYPNPFNPSTTIEFSLNKQEANVTLSIYNINGELISDLIKSSNFSPGTYKITFDASKLASGNYFYKLKAGNRILTKKMTLIK